MTHEPQRLPRGRPVLAAERAVAVRRAGGAGVVLGREVIGVKTYRRYNTRLRFEAGQPVPPVGATWIARTELGRVRVRVHLLQVRRVFGHPDEPGVMLMDARISRSEVRDHVQH